MCNVGMVDRTFDFTLSDLDVFASKDNRLGRFAGDRPVASALCDSVASSPVSGGARIRLKC